MRKFSFRKKQIAYSKTSVHESIYLRKTLREQKGWTNRKVGGYKTNQRRGKKAQGRRNYKDILQYMMIRCHWQRSIANSQFELFWDLVQPYIAIYYVKSYYYCNGICLENLTCQSSTWRRERSKPGIFVHDTSHAPQMTYLKSWHPPCHNWTS